jgi:hypothetical protein
MSPILEKPQGGSRRGTEVELGLMLPGAPSPADVTRAHVL